MRHTTSTEGLKEFARRLNVVLEASGIPEHGRTAVLARLTGQSHQGSCKWINGEGFPSIANLTRIAVRYNINLNWLLVGIGPMFNVNVTDEEASMVYSLRRLDERGKIAVRKTIDAESAYVPPVIPTVHNESHRAICEIYDV